MRKYCNRMSEKKKNSLILTNVHVLYMLKDKRSKKNFRLSGCMYVRGLFILFVFAILSFYFVYILRL